MFFRQTNAVLLCQNFCHDANGDFCRSLASDVDANRAVQAVRRRIGFALRSLQLWMRIADFMSN